jgi:o-succinylbenzoate synthase
VRRSLVRLSLPLREPFATANGVVSARELLLLRIEDPDDGAFGYGEAAPFEPYDGVSLEEVAAALSNGSSGDGPPQARTAEEMARLDLEARREGRPIGEPGAERIAVNRTLPAGPPDEVAARAREGVQEGYACFKLKVGLPDDAERVAAVREAIGPWPALRIDANGAWSAGEAVEAITALEPYDLQLVEQPCRTLEEMAEVRRAVGVPVAADESVATAEDVRRASDAGACDTVNVKLAASGGFGPAREALRAASESGLSAFLSSTLDGPWGIAAALQLAASENLSLACGLATLELFDASLARALPPPDRGLMAVPQGPGLGVAVDEGAIAEVLVEELE